jgi:putative hydroxymethylpyrimidine transporter CytX
LSTLLERADVLHEWGIEPIPETHRRLGAFDLAILWGDLGIGLLVLVAGALLVPALGFVAAFGAIVLGSAIGVALLALGAREGAAHGLPTMVLLRPVLGLRGSWIPSVFNALQLIGWTAVELWAMSYVADLVAREVFGWSVRYLWLTIASVVCIGLSLWGPVGVTRVWMERFAAWIAVWIVLIVAILLFTTDDLGAALSAPGTGDLPFGLALDLVIAMPISWLPLVADYSRFAHRPRSAFLGTFFGYFVANVVLYSLGALLVLNAGADPSPGGIAAGILALAGGTFAGVMFLVGLLVVETDEAFADIYSGAVTLQNIFSNATQRVLVLLVGITGTLLAAWFTMERYESFLFLIGSVFVPLFGMFAADHFVNRRGRLHKEELYGVGRYWFSGGIRWTALIPWGAGFLLYHWIAPVGPDWWIDAVDAVTGGALIEQVPWLGASVPSFVLAFLLSLRPRLSSEPVGPPTERPQ